MCKIAKVETKYFEDEKIETTYYKSVSRSKIRTVTVHYPTGKKMEELEIRHAKAVTKVLCDTYPPEVIDIIIKKLKEAND